MLTDAFEGIRIVNSTTYAALSISQSNEFDSSSPAKTSWLPRTAFLSENSTLALKEVKLTKDRSLEKKNVCCKGN